MPLWRATGAHKICELKWTLDGHPFNLHRELLPRSRGNIENVPPQILEDQASSALQTNAHEPGPPSVATSSPRGSDTVLVISGASFRRSQAGSSHVWAEHRRLARSALDRWMAVPRRGRPPARRRIHVRRIVPQRRMHVDSVAAWFSETYGYLLARHKIKEFKLARFTHFSFTATKCVKPPPGTAHAARYAPEPARRLRLARRMRRLCSRPSVSLLQAFHAPTPCTVGHSVSCAVRPVPLCNLQLAASQESSTHYHSEPLPP